MRHTKSVSIFAHEQPNKKVWQKLDRFVREWNCAHTNRFASILQTMWIGTFDEKIWPELDSLLQTFGDLESKEQAVYHINAQTALEEADYDVADYIGVLGVGLGSDAKPFLLNHDKAFKSPVPCAECNNPGGGFDWRQVAPLVVNESLMFGETDEGRMPGDRGWDLINMEHGQLVISRFCKELLDEHDVRGYRVSPVYNKTEDRTSENLYQLTAEKTIVSPCRTHTTMEGGTFCQTCGLFQGRLVGYFNVSSDKVGDDEVIANFANGTSIFFVSRRVYRLMLTAGVTGLYRNDARFICPKPHLV